MRIRYWKKKCMYSSSIRADNGSVLYFHTKEAARNFVFNNIIPRLPDGCRYSVCEGNYVYKDAKFILHPNDFNVDYIIEILDDIDFNLYSASCAWDGCI